MQNNRIDIKSLRNSTKTVSFDEGSPKRPAGGLIGLLNRDIQFSTGLPDALKENFYLELSVLLDAGVDMKSSLELVKDGQAKLKYRQIFEKLISEVVNGSALSAALKSSNKFTLYESLSIQIGEETGKMILVLKELASYFKKKIKQRRQIIGALTYPAIVLSIAVVAVFFMLGYVVPMFTDVFRRFGSDLPSATKLVITLSAIIKKYFIFLILLVLVLIWIGFKQRKTIWFRSAFSRICLKLPIVGNLIGKIYISRFANTMSLLIGAKIPILNALQMCREITGFYPIESALAVVQLNITQGMDLHSALAEFSIFPKKMIIMLKVGEDVNQLDMFFNKIALQYDEEVEHQTNLFSKAIEPIIIVFLGLVVGFILIAMYLPLFKLGQVF